MSNANVKALHLRTDKFGVTEFAVEFSNDRFHAIAVSPFTRALDFADALEKLAHRITLDPALNGQPKEARLERPMSRWTADHERRGVTINEQDMINDDPLQGLRPSADR